MPTHTFTHGSMHTHTCTLPCMHTNSHTGTCVNSSHRRFTQTPAGGLGRQSRTGVCHATGMVSPKARGCRLITPQCIPGRDKRPQASSARSGLSVSPLWIPPTRSAIQEEPRTPAPPEQTPWPGACLLPSILHLPLQGPQAHLGLSFPSETSTQERSVFVLRSGPKYNLSFLHSSPSRLGKHTLSMASGSKHGRSVGRLGQTWGELKEPSC